MQDTQQRYMVKVTFPDGEEGYHPSRLYGDNLRGFNDAEPMHKSDIESQEVEQQYRDQFGDEVKFEYVPVRFYRRQLESGGVEEGWEEGELESAGDEGGGDPAGGDPDPDKDPEGGDAGDGDTDNGDE